MGQKHADRWLTSLGCGRMAAALREEVLTDTSGGRQVVHTIVGKQQLGLQGGEQLEAQRERWESTGTLREWSGDGAIAESGVRDELRHDADEVGAEWLFGAAERGRGTR
jgi:hypothetical protein